MKRISLSTAIVICQAHGEDVQAALHVCKAHGRKVTAFQSGTGVRFDVAGVRPDVGTFGLFRLVEGLVKR